MRRSALALSLTATAGVMAFGVLKGIVIAIVLAVVLFIRRGWQPHGSVLGHADGGWHSTEVYPDADQVPGVVVYRWEAPLFFANANSFRSKIRTLVREQQPRWLIVQSEAVTDIDLTAADMLEQLSGELESSGTRLVMVEVRSRIQALLHRYGVFVGTGPRRIYPTIDAALGAAQGECDR